MDFLNILTEKNVLMIEGIFVSDKIRVYGCMFYCDFFKSPKNAVINI